MSGETFEQQCFQVPLLTLSFTGLSLAFENRVFPFDWVGRELLTQSFTIMNINGESFAAGMVLGMVFAIVSFALGFYTP